MSTWQTEATTSKFVFFFLGTTGTVIKDLYRLCGRKETKGNEKGEWRQESNAVRVTLRGFVFLERPILGRWSPLGKSHVDVEKFASKRMEIF